MKLWAKLAPALKPNVDGHALHLLGRCDVCLAHRSAPESTHEELLKSERMRDHPGCYDLLTLCPGFSDVEACCMNHAEPRKERDFFKNHMLKKIRQCMKLVQIGVG